MESKNFRIGNLVIFNDRIHSISTIYEHNHFKLKDEHGGELVSAVEVDFTEPIWITEEWLICLGAKKFNHAFLYDRFRLIPRPEYGFYQVVCKETNVYITKVEFVHEWQNVVSVLNGQELVYESK